MKKFTIEDINNNKSRKYYIDNKISEALNGSLEITKHGIERMVERNIEEAEILQCLEKGTIKDYTKSIKRTVLRIEYMGVRVVLGLTKLKLITTYRI